MKDCICRYLLTSGAGFLFLFSSPVLFAQTTDSSFYRQVVSNVIERYKKVKGDARWSLYNGVEEPGYLYTIQGSAYFGSDNWQQSSLFYDGVLYTDIPIKYDEIKDLVLILHSNGYTTISLYSPRIKYFTLPEHHFIYLEQKSESDPPSGFYEVLRSGKMTLLAKRKKTIKETLVPPEIKQEFVENYTYYLLKDGVYNAVRNESGALSLMGEKRGEIQKMLRSEKIRFRKNRELALIRMTDQFNQ